MEGKFFVNPGSATGAMTTGWWPEEEDPTPSFVLMDVRLRAPPLQAATRQADASITGPGRRSGALRVPIAQGRQRKRKCRSGEGLVPEKWRWPGVKMIGNRSSQSPGENNDTNFCDAHLRTSPHACAGLTRREADKACPLVSYFFRNEAYSLLTARLKLLEHLYPAISLTQTTQATVFLRRSGEVRCCQPLVKTWRLCPMEFDAALVDIRPG